MLSYERCVKNWKTAVYRFSISYLVPGLQSFEDAEIKAKSGEKKTRNFVTSQTFDKDSLDS